MVNPKFPTDDLARAALLIKAHETAKLDRKAGYSVLPDSVLAVLEAARFEFIACVERYTESMEAGDTVQVDEPTDAGSALPGTLEQQLDEARQRADRAIRLVHTEIATSLQGKGPTYFEQTYRRYGFIV
jgi:hypothetical protein